MTKLYIVRVFYGELHCATFLFLQGRQDGTQIDPWEDADFALYKVTDRFGFLQ